MQGHSAAFRQTGDTGQAVGGAGRYFDVGDPETLTAQFVAQILVTLGLSIWVIEIGFAINGGVTYFERCKAGDFSLAQRHPVAFAQVAAFNEHGPLHEQAG